MATAPELPAAGASLLNKQPVKRAAAPPSPADVGRRRTWILRLHTLPTALHIVTCIAVAATAGKLLGAACPASPSLAGVALAGAILWLVTKVCNSLQLAADTKVEQYRIQGRLEQTEFEAKYVIPSDGFGPSMAAGICCLCTCLGALPSVALLCAALALAFRSEGATGLPGGLYSFVSNNAGDDALTGAAACTASAYLPLARALIACGVSGALVLAFWGRRALSDYF